jgi:hypothetical protein
VAERETESARYGVLRLPVAAGETIERGHFVICDGNGYARAFAIPMVDAAAMGRAEATADNSAGGDGDELLTVRQGVFRWDNSGADAVTQASLGRPCYLEDSETVRATQGGDYQVAAGTVLNIDVDGVWVKTTP